MGKPAGSVPAGFFFVGMNEKSKAAYRSIVYQFLLDVRTVPLPLTDAEQAVRIGRYAGPVAYQLHNLALASAQDFVSFSEADFWVSMEAFDERNPDTTIAHYRKVFDLALAEQDCAGGLFFVSMDTVTTSRLRQISYLLAIGISTFLVDTMIVAILWANGIDYQIYTAVPPGSPGYQILPMSASYKWLLSAMLALNIGLLYLLARQRHRYLLGFAVGTTVPMGYLLYVLLTS